MIRLYNYKNLLLLFLYFFACAAVATSYQFTPAKPINEIIKQLLNANDHSLVTHKKLLVYKKAMAALYSQSPQPLVWHSEENGDDEKIADVLKLISTAKESGLNQSHYNLNLLKTHWLQLKNRPDIGFYEQAVFDMAISLNLIHFLSDLQYGRINPQTLNYHFEPKEKAPLSFAPLILSAIQNNEISLLVNKIEPDLPAYQQLKKALSIYRTRNDIAKYTHLKYISSLHPKDNSPQVIVIRQHLNQFKTQENTDFSANCLYDEKLVSEIKNFQVLHGLLDDGIIGKKTIQALNIPLSERILKIELALERLRWLPRIDKGPRIIVNIPAFQLSANKTGDTNNSEQLNMKVIVGKSKKRKSPVFTADMYYLEFSPYWNIPKSITLEEIIPKLLENPQYIDQQNMEIVSGFHNNEIPVAYTEETITQLKVGALKLRQRPGRGNALGKVKFIFPNNYNVYLHDTSSRGLFRKPKRDLSHGCIRVEKPFELANFLLQSKPGWNQNKTRKAMNLPHPKQVRLKQSVPVIIFYSTVSAVKDKIYFYNDIYGYDAKLNQALIQHDKAQKSVITPMSSY